MREKLIKAFGLSTGEWIWLGTGIALLAYEFVAVFGPGDVLTRAYRANTTRWTSIPVGVGILMGHLHGTVYGGFAGKWSPILFILVEALALARDVFIGTRVEPEMILPLFVAGLGVGLLAWIGSP